jgi:hypothetical protein
VTVVRAVLLADSALVLSRLGDHEFALSCADEIRSISSDCLRTIEAVRRGSMRAVVNPLARQKGSAKAKVRELWDEWQKGEHSYRNKTDFADQILDLYPDLLRSTEVILRWIRDFERTR